MIVGLDPGPTYSALVYFTGDRAQIPRYAENALILETVGLLNGEPLAIEMIASYGMAVGQEVFETCVWIGRFAQAYDRQQQKAAFVYRRDVKLHLCGSVRARDTNVRQALIDKLGPVGTKKSPGPCYGISGDLWSALAVAVTYAEWSRCPRVIPAS